MDHGAAASFVDELGIVRMLGVPVVDESDNRDIAVRHQVKEGRAADAFSGNHRVQDKIADASVNKPSE